LVAEKFEKMSQNETIKRFLIGNTNINISTNQGQLRVRTFTKLSEGRQILNSKRFKTVKT